MTDTGLSIEELEAALGLGAAAPVPSPVPAPVDTGLSVVELEEALRPPTKLEGVASAAKRGLVEIPETISRMPAGIGQIGADIGRTVTGDLEAAERTARTTGKMASAFAGAATGGTTGVTLGAMTGPLAPIMVPALGVGGAAFGGAAGMLGFDFLERFTGTQEPRSGQEDVENVVYDTVQDLGLFGLGKAAKRTTKATAGVAPPLTDAARQRQTVKSLKRLGVNETLDDLPADPLGTKSIAELTEKPELAAVEAQLPKQFPEEVRPRLAARQAARTEKQIAGIQDIEPSQVGLKEPLPVSEVGEIAQQGLKAERAVRNKVVSEVYNSLDKDTLIDISGAQKKVVDVLDKYQGEFADPLPKVLSNKLSEIFDAPQEVRLEGVDNLGRALGDIAGDPNNSRTVRTIAGEVKEALDESAFKNSALADARKLRKELGKDFDEGAVGKILATKKFGEVKTLPSQVPDLLLKNREAASQFARNASPDALVAMQDHIGARLKALLDKGNVQTAVNYADVRAEAISEILGPDKYAKFSQSIEDLRSQADFTRGSALASKGQSITTEGLLSKGYIDDLVGAKLPELAGRRSGTALVLSGIVGYSQGGVMGSLIGPAFTDMVLKKLKGTTGKTAAYLYDHLTDPQKARELLAKYEAGDIKANAGLDLLDKVTDELLRRENIPTYQVLGKKEEERRPAAGFMAEPSEASSGLLSSLPEPKPGLLPTPKKKSPE